LTQKKTSSSFIEKDRVRQDLHKVDLILLNYGVFIKVCSLGVYDD